MEEKKQRNKFYSAWAKGIVIALFLTAVACFSVFAMIFGGLMHQGFSWEELTSNYYNGKNYLTGYTLCRQEDGWQIQSLSAPALSLESGEVMRLSKEESRKTSEQSVLKAEKNER